MCDICDQGREELRRREAEFNEKTIHQFDPEMDTDTAYRVAILAAQITMRRSSDSALAAARELLLKAGYFDLRRQELARLREHAQLSLDVQLYNRECAERHPVPTAGSLFPLTLEQLLGHKKGQGGPGEGGPVH